MDTVRDEVVTVSAKIEEKDKVRASQLLAVFKTYEGKITTLSLDCFDTILWRTAATPRDVFFDLQQRPTFKSLQFTALMRTQAESDASKMKMLATGSNQVNLKEIYQHAFPELNDADCAALAEEELAAEMETCYAFPPLIELMRLAIASNMKIVIVSDTYLERNQLERLLATHLPDDVMQNIHSIFTSYEYGILKSDGLFSCVLKELNQAPESILHLGDNPLADLLAARCHKINSLQLIHNESEIENFYRMHTAANSIADTAIRQTRSLNNCFRGVFATNFHTNEPESLIGYASLGPIMYSFSQFIIEEIKELKIAGKNPKVLFLLRDAYLPAQVCEAIAGEKIGALVCISRFASQAASLRTIKDIDKILSQNAGALRFYDVCRQLLLPEKLAVKIVKKAELAGNFSIDNFIKQIQEKNITEIIIKNSAAYCERLMRYLNKEVGIEAGDTLIFVDLGYSGTAQRLLEPIFKEKGIDVLGRYLIAFGIPGWQYSRRGLLDPSNCDARTMMLYVAYIALLEQLCTTTGSSVVDYDENGNPLFSESGLEEDQFSKLDLIQAECIRFAKDATQFFQATNCKLSAQMLRDSAVGELGRLLFFQNETEMQYLESFKFDLNLGTGDLFKVIDRAKGLSSLQKKGMFFSFLEKSSTSIRTNYPAELRSAGLELSLMLMTQFRFDLDLKLNDMSLRREKVNILLVRGSEVVRSTLEATLTYDGYFAMTVPVGFGNLQVGILFGQEYQWIQIESIDLIRADAYLSKTESKHTEDYSSVVLFSQMDKKEGGLFECVTNEGLMMLVAPVSDAHNILRVVFRPTVRRSC